MGYDKSYLNSSIVSIVKMAKTSTPATSDILSDIIAKYQKTTPTKIKLIDGFLAYVLATGILQFVYCILVGTFPFNSFLSGFVCTVGVFVLAGIVLMFYPQDTKLI